MNGGSTALGMFCQRWKEGPAMVVGSRQVVGEGAGCYVGKSSLGGIFSVAPVRSLTILSIGIIICLLFPRKDIHRYKLGAPLFLRKDIHGYKPGAPSFLGRIFTDISFGALEMHSEISLNAIQVKRLVFH